MRKLTREEFKRTENESPLNLFHQGIKAEETREKYTRTLRHVLCKIFEEIFEGEFEERVNEFVKLAREDPKWATDLLLNLSRILRERTKLKVQRCKWVQLHGDSPTKLGLKMDADSHKIILKFS